MEASPLLSVMVIGNYRFSLSLLLITSCYCKQIFIWSRSPCKFITYSADVAGLAAKRQLNKNFSFPVTHVSINMGLFKIICWPLIFLTRLHFPQGSSIATILSELLQITRVTLLFDDFVPRASQLCHRMCLQGGSRAKLNLQIPKAIRKYPSVFEKFNSTPEDVISKIISHDG